MESAFVRALDETASYRIEGRTLELRDAAGKPRVRLEARGKRRAEPVRTDQWTHDPPPARDLGRITLSVLAIGLVIAASLWVVWPFMAAGIWATMIVVATWPMMLAVQARLGGRRWLAVTVMTSAMLLVLVVPLTLAVATIVDHADEIVDWSKDLASATIPSPPDWVEELPLVGPKISTEWAKLAATSREDLTSQAAPYVRKVIQWFAGQAGGFGLTLLHLLLTLVITAILYATGETAALGVRRFARRLAAERGDSLVVLAGTGDTRGGARRRRHRDRAIARRRPRSRRARHSVRDACLPPSSSCCASRNWAPYSFSRLPSAGSTGAAM